MSVVQMPTTVERVADQQGESRGASFQDRRIALGLSRSELAKRAKVDRSRVQKLEEGGTLQDSKLGAIERTLSELEHAMGMDLPSEVRPIGDPADDLMEVTVEGNFGVRAVVRGPVRDSAAIQAFVRELIADMNNGRESKD